jgi:hypothetical protein
MVVASGEIATLHTLHFDHPGTEVDEIAGGQRSGDGLLDGDDGEPVEWEGHNAFFWA